MWATTCVTQERGWRATIHRHRANHNGGSMADTAGSDTFHDIVVLARPELRPVCEALRELIASEHDGFLESIWPKMRMASYGVGPKKMTQHYAYIAVQAGHINLGFYHGTSLRDPQGVLTGTGKALRHVRIDHVARVSDPAIRDLLRQAIADRRRPA
ncbi:MAG: DUF1801 domain-containing protein [Xanthomonadales bacterium]|nr:DUF1801 domain-containing protein [Xanthomonadales bacterium]MDL1870066.1 DUF1801 domain-containing protein [Gammaproteobacteria bacterium PRO6]